MNVSKDAKKNVSYAAACICPFGNGQAGEAQLT